jgi:hypothetical protein
LAFEAKTSQPFRTSYAEFIFPKLQRIFRGHRRGGRM